MSWLLLLLRTLRKPALVSVAAMVSASLAASEEPFFEHVGDDHVSFGNWFWRSSLPWGNWVNDSHFAGDLHVAVGERGVYVSEDGTTWVPHALPGVERMLGVTYHDGLWVAVGRGGAIATSSDGHSWSSTPSPVTSHLNSVVYGSAGFVAVGGTATLLSENGTDWEVVSATTGHAVVYGNGLYVIGGSYGDAFVSDDGRNWEPASEGPAGHVRGLAFGNERFVAAGLGGTAYISSSADGVTWTEHYSGSPGWFTDATFSHGRFVLVGANHFATSINGENWQIHPRPFAQSFSTVHPTPEGFFGLAEYGSTAVSTDGAGWDLISPDLPERLNAGATDGSKAVFVGEGLVVVMEGNHTRWYRPEILQNVRLNGITHGDRFVAVGQGEGPFDSSDKIFHSTDGIHWEATTIPGAFLRSVTYGDGKYVAVGSVTEGEGIIMCSSDGITWSICFTTSVNLRGVAYGAGRYVATGDDRTVVGSADGFQWTILEQDPTRGPLHDVTYGNGMFVTAGSGMRSTDGVNWSPGGPTGRAVTYGAGMFMALQSDGSVRVSFNGAQWHEREPISQDLYTRQLLFHDDSFFICGWNGLVAEYRIQRTDDWLESAGFDAETLNLLKQQGLLLDPGDTGFSVLERYAFAMDPLAPSLGDLPAMSRSDTHVDFSFNRPSQPSDLTYLIEASEDMVNWTPVTNYAIHSSGDGDVTERVRVSTQPSAPWNPLPRRFFRVRVEHTPQ